jgi:hypothetical protein
MKMILGDPADSGGPMDVEALSAKPRLRLLLDHFAKIKDTRQS